MKRKGRHPAPAKDPMLETFDRLVLARQFRCVTCGIILAGPFGEWPAHCCAPAALVVADA